MMIFEPFWILTNITMENHHFSWVNQLFLWPFSIVFCVFTRPGKQSHFLPGILPGSPAEAPGSFGSFGSFATTIGLGAA